jgi:iron complex outermembrane receptor protein
VRVRGVELEGRGEVSPGLNIIATASYTDAIITQGAPAIAPTATSNGAPSTTGTRQLGTPKWEASTYVSYDLKQSGRFSGPLSGLTLGAGVRYVGGSDGTTSYGVFNNITTFQRFRTDSFVLVDALVGYDLGVISPRMEGLSLALNVANLFDERHVTACPFHNSCYFGSGRTVIGSIRYAW